jgi:UDP-glucose:(heptosyl)LPS alpha-1,3-glucosyltransferase
MHMPVYKIAVVIPKYGLIGGAEGFVAELTERIARDLRYDVHVFANQWAALSDGITFHRVPIITVPKFMTTPSFAWFAGRMISRMGFDLVHAHDRIFTADVFTMHGIPHRFWIKNVRGKGMMSLYDTATSWVERKLVFEGRCACFLAVSGLVREIFLREYPIDFSRVAVINPGVATCAYSMNAQMQARRDIRAEFGIDPAVPLILFVSMNFEVKGLDRLIAGLGELRRRRPADDFRLLVVGKGNQPAYRRLAEGAGIVSQVIFTGPLPRERLEAIYQAGDMYAMLSKFDTFGLVVLEAMAASLPVVISGNVGARDVVRHGVNGFVIEDTADAKGIAETIALLLDEKIRAKMGEESLRTARENTWEAAADKVIKVYEDILQRPVSSKMPQP